MLLVTCAVIKKDNLYLAVQRSARMKFPLKWEFPGGKLEAGELPEDGLKREIREELQLEIGLLEKLEPVEHDYGTFHIKLLPYLAYVKEGNLILQEHTAFRWLHVHQLDELDWAGADWPVVRQLQEK